jgi:hypothetical protein
LIKWLNIKYDGSTKFCANKNARLQKCCQNAKTQSQDQLSSPERKTGFDTVDSASHHNTQFSLKRLQEPNFGLNHLEVPRDQRLVAEDKPASKSKLEARRAHLSRSEAIFEQLYQLWNVDPPTKRALDARAPATTDRADTELVP